MDHQDKSPPFVTLTNSHLITISSHSDKILSGLKELRNDPTFTDAILCAGSNEYPCHRAVLASSSPYFKAMFSSHLRESHDNRVSFNDMSNAALAQIINFIYTGQAEVNYENAQDLLAAASLLQYYEVVDACCEFLKCHLHSTNCLGIEWFSHLHSLLKLESEAQQYAVENFDSVIESDEFLQLSPERLCWYLACSNIDVSSEEKLYEAVVRWSERVQYPESALCQVFNLIRFNFMSPSYLSEVATKGRHFQNCERCLSLVTIHSFNGKDVLIENYPDEASQSSLLISTPRPSTLAKEVIVILSSDDSDYGVLEIFDPVKERWSVLSDERLPCTLIGSGITTVGNDIYVTGGIRREQVLSEVWCFLSNERRWISLPSLSMSRAYHSCTSWDNCVYVFGGLSNCSAERRHAVAIEIVECLDLNNVIFTKKSEIINMNWKVVAKIPCPRIGSCAVAIEGTIIEVGGTQYGIPVKKLESYRWVPIPHPWGSRVNVPKFGGSEQLVLPDLIERSQIVVVDGQLYILWMDSGKFILLNPTKRIFKDLTRPCTLNIGGMAVVGSKIFVIGTWNSLDIGTSKLIECYDTINNVWVSTKYFDKWLNNVRCVTVKIKITP